MTNRFPHLAQRLFNTPIAIHPDKADVIMAALADRLGIARLFHQSAFGEPGSPQPMAWDDDDGGSRHRRQQRTESGYDIAAGVALVPICGTLVQKTGCLRPYSGMTGYDGIRVAFANALEDPDVEAIVFDIDSPGGEVAGCFDLVDTLYRARGIKPVWAILNEMACSAAYAIASAADRITVPRTGVTGSIGVILMHVELSRALAAEGITVTIIQYGDRKSDGADTKPLDNTALGRFQADIDTMGDLFTATVARNRGLPVAAIRAQQAMTYRGAMGVEAGLADAVMAPDEAFKALLATI